MGRRQSIGQSPARRARFFEPAVLVVALFLAGCGSPQDPARPRDLLLITIDTARADRFSYAGSSEPGTPRIDALAAEGAGFTRAISPVPLTLPAHATLMTGRQPPSHGIRDNGTFRLPAAETTLAEAFSEAGFATAAFVGAQVLEARYGLDQGFDLYDDAMPAADEGPFLAYAERSADEVIAAATGWIERQGDRPLFVWVHLFDPHTPYRPPEPERSSHGSAYDGEIAFVDRMIGRLLDQWQASRGLDRTAVVVTSDHGEALGEHGEATHGTLVHEATLRVPLVLRIPGWTAAEPIDSTVHLIDVMPTVLATFAIPQPDGLAGRDLRPLIRGEPLAWRTEAGYAESLYAQLHHGCAPLFSLRSGAFKLVRGREVELYDLERDPGEIEDRADREPGRVASLTEDLLDLQRRWRGGEAERLILDPDARAALEALGYLTSGPAGGPGSTGSCDARETLAAMSRMAEADRLLVAGDVAGAIDRYLQVIDDAPGSVDARVRLARVLATEGRVAESLPLLRQAAELAPHEIALHYRLGYTLEKLGRYPESLAAYDAGLARHPGERELRDGRWRCLNRLGRYEILLEEAERAIAADPTDGMARFARAVGCCSQPTEAYRRALQRELAELPDDPVLRAAWAQVTGSAGE